MLAGICAAAASAALSISHLIDSGQKLLSPMTAAAASLVLASAAAAVAVGAALSAGRRLIALGLIVAVIAGEAYSLVSSAERLLLVREDRSRQAAFLNTARAIAIDKVKTAHRASAQAEAAFVAEAGRGGCGRACRELRHVAEEARVRLETIQAALLTAPTRRSEHLLSDTLGLDPRVVDIVPALLFSVALNGLALLLLAFAAHRPRTPLKDGSTAGDLEPAPVAFARHLRLLAVDGRIEATQRELSAALGISRSSVNRHLRRLARSGQANVRTTPMGTVITLRRN